MVEIRVRLESNKGSIFALRVRSGAASSKPPPMSTSYQPLQKRILSQAQLESFQTTETHAAVINYIAALNDCVIGVKLTDDCGELSPVSLCRGYPCVYSQ